MILTDRGTFEGVFISSYSGHFFKGKPGEAAKALPLGEAAFKALGVTFPKKIIIGE